VRFISVTKPGIIFGNMVTVSGGFFLGSSTHISFWLLLTTLASMSLIIGAGCVFNNYIDRDIDHLMERTKNRVLVLGLMSGKAAIAYAIVLSFLGFGLLYQQTNLLTLVIAAIGFFFYVVVYSLAMKRHSSYGTLAGSVSGAVPPVVGYCAVTNRFDMGAVILFAILVLWQMPHFYAIAIYRLNDYRAAGIPVLPLRHGMRYTKITMLLYTIAFALVSVLPFVWGYVGYVYLSIASILGLIWIVLGIQGFTADSSDDVSWARKMFTFSLINITVLCIAMAIKI
jgi:protoheme IX farnesyltransferase